jgi:transposase
MYLWNRYGLDVTRQTVYNWIKRGRKSISGNRLYLKAQETQNGARVSSSWVDDFVQAQGLRPSREST